jgi:hypothetical protein
LVVYLGLFLAYSFSALILCCVAAKVSFYYFFISSYYSLVFFDILAAALGIPTAGTLGLVVL